MIVKNLILLYVTNCILLYDTVYLYLIDVFYIQWLYSACMDLSEYHENTNVFIMLTITCFSQ